MFAYAFCIANNLHFRPVFRKKIRTHTESPPNSIEPARVSAAPQSLLAAHCFGRCVLLLPLVLLLLCHVLLWMYFTSGFLSFAPLDSMTFVGKSNEIRCHIHNVRACVVHAFEFMMKIYHQIAFRNFFFVLAGPPGLRRQMSH